MTQYRIVRIYERFYVEAFKFNKFFIRNWRRVSPRGGFSTRSEAKGWWLNDQKTFRRDYEVVEHLTPEQVEK